MTATIDPRLRYTHDGRAGSVRIEPALRRQTGGAVADEVWFRPDDGGVEYPVNPDDLQPEADDDRR